ncbi:MAG: hypothetical protein ACJ74Z_18245 [Bryobacteraceae bacterium]
MPLRNDQDFNGVLAVVVQALPGVPALEFSEDLLDVARDYDVPRQAITTWLEHRAPQKEWSINGFERWCAAYRPRRDQLLYALRKNRTGKAGLCPKCGMPVVALQGEPLLCPNCHVEVE